MTEPTTIMLVAWDWIRDFAVLLFGVIFYNQRKAQKEIDKIKADYVLSGRFEKAIDRMREDMHNMHDQIRQDIKSLGKRLDK